MAPDKLKEKLEKKEAELRDLKKQVKDAELAQQKAQEEAAKLEALSPQITEAIQTVLNTAKVSLPQGKQIICTVGEMGLSTSIVNGKSVKTKTGNGGAKALTFEEQQISWARLCEIKNIVRTPAGSAHRDVYNKAKELHDSIQHKCSIDGKTYPVS